MEKEVKAEVLEVLRDITKLGPIAAFKVERARKNAEYFTKLYRKENPSDQIGVDYSTANDLEYELRMNALRKGLERSWASYLAYEQDGIGLDEYVEEHLLQRLNENTLGRSR